MGSVGALETRLSFRRNGADVAADIGRGQAEATQSRDHDMREILTHAAARLEGFRQRRRDQRRFLIVSEILADAAHQVDRAGKDRLAGRKALGRIIGRGIVERHELRRENEMGRRAGVERLYVGDFAPHLFPGGSEIGVRLRLAPDFDAGERGDAQFPMRFLDAHRRDEIAEEIGSRHARDRRWRDLDAAVEHALPATVARREAQGAERGGDRRIVGISGDVPDVVDHASPLGVSARTAFEPCRK